jgi:hypothetical protein
MIEILSSAPATTSGLSTGAVIALALLGVAIWVVFIIAYVKIITRAGYSGWWVLIILVPIANIVMLLVFAFKEWPIQRELRELRGWANQIQKGGGGPSYGQGYGQTPGYGQDPGYPQNPGYPSS